MITAKGKPMQWREGLTVEEVLKTLGYAVPAAVVRLDGQPVRRQDWAATRVLDGAVVDVRVMAAGG